MYTVVLYKWYRYMYTVVLYKWYRYMYTVVLYKWYRYMYTGVGVFGYSVPIDYMYCGLGLICCLICRVLSSIKLELLCQITKIYPNPSLLIISLKIVQTRIILLHVHPQVVYCSCVKTYQLMEDLRLQDIWTDKRMENHLSQSDSCKRPPPLIPCFKTFGDIMFTLLLHRLLESIQLPYVKYMHQHWIQTLPMFPDTPINIDNSQVSIFVS